MSDSEQEITGSDLSIRDSISKKLRGAVSMVLLVRGEGRQYFANLGDDWQDAFLDTIIDLAQEANTLNQRRNRI